MPFGRPGLFGRHKSDYVNQASHNTAEDHLVGVNNSSHTALKGPSLA
jgi:hypothetical protein